jgi:hypothetical protein
MPYEEGVFRSLIEESQDLHSGGMKAANEALDELVEVSKDEDSHADSDEAGRESDHRGLGAGAKVGGALAAGAVGATVFGATAAYAAATNVNIQCLQTSASLENLAVATYTKALTLPYIANGNAVIKQFAQTTMQQHAQHAIAFNGAAVKLGGKKQTKTNPHFTPVVTAAVPKLAAASATTGPPMVVSLAISLEKAASETYSKNCQLMNNLASRTVMSSILGIDCQHLAVLLAVQALLPTPNLIAIPTDVASLPAAAGSVGFPDTFYANDPAYARPPQEGAVK